MSRFPWKTTLAVSALLAATAYAFAQMSSSGGPMGMRGPMQQSDMMSQMHSQMMQGQGGMHGGMGMHGMGGQGGMHGEQSAATGAPTMPGQDAFGTIQEIVQFYNPIPRPIGRRSTLIR
jgi:hypothetical protein